MRWPHVIILYLCEEDAVIFEYLVYTYFVFKQNVRLKWFQYVLAFLFKGFRKIWIVYRIIWWITMTLDRVTMT